MCVCVSISQHGGTIYDKKKSIGEKKPQDEHLNKRNTERMSLILIVLSSLPVTSEDDE